MFLYRIACLEGCFPFSVRNNMSWTPAMKTIWFVAQRSINIILSLKKFGLWPNCFNSISIRVLLVSATLPQPVRSTELKAFLFLTEIWISRRQNSSSDSSAAETTTCRISSRTIHHNTLTRSQESRRLPARMLVDFAAITN